MKPHLHRMRFFDGVYYWVCRLDSVHAWAPADPSGDSFKEMTDAYRMWKDGKAKKDAFNRGN